MPFVTWLIHLPSKLLHPACSQLELINGKWQTASGCHLPLVTWLILPFSTLVHPACSQLELINVKWQTANGRGGRHLPFVTWLIHPFSALVHPTCSQLELISGKCQVAATCHLPLGSSTPSPRRFILPALNLSSSVASGKWQGCHLPTGSSIFSPGHRIQLSPNAWPLFILACWVNL